MIQVPNFAIKPGYRPQSEDTSIENDLLIFHLLRQRTAGERLSMAEAGFYVSGVDDVKSGRMRTLQITEIESISRADLVIAGTDEFDGLKFERRRIFATSGAEALYFASPEDVILNKLRWRQRSGSEKQWRDVLGVLKVQGETLDYAYLRDWAERLGLTDDLSRALTEAGIW